ncbi:MAG TPA: Gfo/Idh/MocA family oxidoreductase [Candidatus Methylacidiphilales bacterium]|jgi:predicted dehydrogenase|nr:Gfo/Idh/MocA family oxidoreductase [Candidatus Methylacidiphilales bacterium]
MKSKIISPLPGKTNSHLQAGAPPCRIALLGCGAVSELYHAPALRQLEAEGAAVVAAVFDPDAERAAKLCRQFPNAVCHRDESFLEKAPLDLAIVASPVSFHEAHAIRALEAGIAVLCEKPLAATTAAGDRMIAAALKHQRILAVGLLRRFYSNVQFTRQVIQNKTWGPVVSFSIQEGGPFDWPARSDSFFRKATAGGGVLLDLGVHVLDLAVHWFGEPLGLSYADDAMGGLEATCRIELSYPAGFKGTVHLSRDWKTSNLYVIKFERGTLKLRAGEAERVELELNDSSFVLESSLKNRTGPDSPAGAVSPASTFPQAFLAQLRDLIFAVRKAGRPTVPAEEGIRSLRLIERCYQNRTLMEMPWLTPEERRSALLPAAGGVR